MNKRDVARFYKLMGEAICVQRMHRGLSQENLGRAIGLTRTSVTNIEAGRQRILAHQVPMVAAALNCRIGDLIGNI